MLSPPDLARPAEAVAQSIADMQARAIDFLLERQEPTGAWRDFFLPAGESTDWVTGYVGLAVAAEPQGAAAARRGWAYLEGAAKPEGGWGYNALTPADADSSIWALRLADALGAGGVVTQAGHDFLARHVRHDGGVATYADADAPRGYVGLPETVDFSAWTVPHVCVSAAAAALPALCDAKLGAFLAGARAADGHWPSYWWFDPGYATAEAVEALGRDDRATRFAFGRLDHLLQQDAPTAFALAQMVRILGRATPDRAIAALAALQADNGSWPASARLRVPAPDCRSPTDNAAWRPWRGLGAMPASLAEVMSLTFTITSLDHRRAFTTATVLRALAAALR